MVEKMKTDVDRLLLVLIMEKNFQNILWNYTFIIFETKSSLSTSFFNFSTISHIFKTKFYVLWTSTCRNLKTVKFANFGLNK